jgi:hypothetical protein
LFALGRDRSPGAAAVGPRGSDSAKRRHSEIPRGR